MAQLLKTRFSNLVKSDATGMYFVRAKVGGRLIRDSLKTDDEKIALSRRDDRLKRERENLEISKNSRAGRMLFEDCSKQYLKESDESGNLKPRTKKYHREMVGIIEKTWLGVGKFDSGKITGEQCKDWADKLKKRYSPSRYNGALDCMRAIFEIAIKAGARLDNPANVPDRASPKQKTMVLPATAQFKALLEYLDSRKTHAKYLVRVLAYSGMRIDEAKNLEWRDVDFDRREIQVRVAKKRANDISPPRRVPMIDELKAVLDDLKQLTGDSARVLTIGTAKKVLKSALAYLQIGHFTHHDLRHLFATRCIESGVDIPTVSRWLGHKDGGALAMKVYGHLRDDHSKAMAAKVKF